MIHQRPFFSIVIVTLNDDMNFFKSIKSFDDQTSNNFEIIAVEGGQPTCRFKAFMNKPKINLRCVSEKDLGIYDAMNKGINLATGKWVIFINSGDTLFKKSTLAKLEEYLTDKSTDICYTDVQLIGNLKPRRLRAQNPNNLKYGMTACHQGLVFNNDVLKNFRFDLKWKICSDYEMICRIYKTKPHDWLFYDQVICTYLAGGFSDKNRLSRDIEEYKIAQKHFGTNLTLIRRLSVNLLRSYVAQKINQFRRYT